MTTTLILSDMLISQLQALDTVEFEYLKTNIQYVEDQRKKIVDATTQRDAELEAAQKAERKTQRRVQRKVECEKQKSVIAAKEAEEIATRAAEEAIILKKRADLHIVPINLKFTDTYDGVPIEIDINQVITNNQCPSWCDNTTLLSGTINRWTQREISCKDVIHDICALIDAGAHPNAPNAKGATSLDYALSDAFHADSNELVDVVTLLLSHGATISHTDDVLALIVERKIEVLKLLVNSVSINLDAVGIYDTDIGFWPDEDKAMLGDFYHHGYSEYDFSEGIRATPLEFAKLWLRFAEKHNSHVSDMKEIVRLLTRE